MNKNLHMRMIFIKYFSVNNTEIEVSASIDNLLFHR